MEYLYNKKRKKNDGAKTDKSGRIPLLPILNPCLYPLPHHKSHTRRIKNNGYNHTAHRRNNHHRCTNARTTPTRHATTRTMAKTNQPHRTKLLIF